MKMKNNWRTDKPPKDTMILADIGLSHAVPAFWNEEIEEWAYAMIEVDWCKGEWIDSYFSSKNVTHNYVSRWMPMPELGTGENMIYGPEGTLETVYKALLTGRESLVASLEAHNVTFGNGTKKNRATIEFMESEISECDEAMKAIEAIAR